MKTILLVDDEPVILAVIREILERFGYRVIARPDGQSALSVIKDGTPVDLVLADYCLPEMDGLELLISVKQIVQDVPLILFTGNSTIENYLKALELGVHKFVCKPIGAKELGRIVTSALESVQAAKAGSEAS